MIEMSNDVEEWRDVPGYEGAYQVSNLGQVRSLAREVRRGAYPMWVPGRVLRPGRSSNGYLTVCLSGESLPVQWLVAAAFIGPRPTGLYVCHRDGSRQNNAYGNLYYGSALENAADKTAHGTLLRGEANGGKLSPEHVREIRSMHRVESQSSLAARFGVSPAAIQAIHDGRTYRHV